MSTTTPQTDTANISFWRKSLNWMRDFEDAMDLDPSQASTVHLQRQVTELEATVRKLQSRLNAQNVEWH